jgi:hypothetical protein
MNQTLENLKKLDKTKPIVLHMGNHGLNPGDNLRPQDATFMCFYGVVAYSQSECLTYEEFGQLMEKAGLTGSQAPPVRIIGDHCYGGGVHYLSTKFSNVCSASIVGYKDSQYSPGTSIIEGNLIGHSGINAFGTTFWRNVKQRGKQASLAEAYNSAWATVPTDDKPGGTLSSIFYMQKVMGLSDENLPTSKRLESLARLERNYLGVNGLYHNAQDDYNKYRGIESYSKPKFTCEIPAAPEARQIDQFKKISEKLNLSQTSNIYQQALEKAQNKNFMKTAQKNKAALDGCYKTAQKSYDKLTAEAKIYMEKSRWSKEFLFKFGDSIDDKKAAFVRGKEKEMAGQVLIDLRSCVEKNSIGVQEYLNTLTNLDRLSQLEAFSKKATPAQKAEFKRKVECESSSLF